MDNKQDQIIKDFIENKNRISNYSNIEEKIKQLEIQRKDNLASMSEDLKKLSEKRNEFYTKFNDFLKKD